MNNWASYSSEQKSAIDLVLVDDGSKVPLIEWPEFANVNVPNLRVYRVTKDLKWNTPGALNLGVTRATTDWVMMMDSDCMLNAENLERLLDFEPDSNKGYQFPRTRITGEKRLKKKDGHILGCTILITKELYFRLGGMDEDFTGEYSGGYGFFDNDFTQRMKHNSGIVSHVYIDEYMEDKVGANVQRRTGVSPGTHHTRNKQLWYRKMNNQAARSTKHLRFEWKEDYARREVVR
jgi:glycosyltransferase involved in cell wall biosynthesis